MQQLTVIENVTLDGVMQAPGRADEDTRDGFRDGGWAVPYGDEMLGRAMGERMTCGGSLVLGRRTYEDFAGYWPGRSDNPFTPVLDAATKHVASRTLRDPLPWQNSVLLGDDAGAAVAALKREPGPGIGVLGSGDLVRTLMARDLVDELLLLIHPLVLGPGPPALRRRHAARVLPPRVEHGDEHRCDHGHAAPRRPAGGSMTQYLLTLYQPDGIPSPDDVDLDRIGRELGALNEEMRAAGAWVFAGGLHPAATSTVVRARGDDLQLTDGPYVEGKEHVGGFTIVEAEDLDEALRWAERLARITGLPVEVRPFQHGS